MVVSCRIFGSFELVKLGKIFGVNLVDFIGFGITFIGIVVTLIFSILNYVYNKKRNKREDYLSRVSDYRLKYIDLVRGPIAEYLESLDKVMKCDNITALDCYNNYREKHYHILSFMTLFSDKEIGEKLISLYDSISIQALLDNNQRIIVSERIEKVLPEMDVLLRGLMDYNWLRLREEIETTGKKK